MDTAAKQADDVLPPRSTNPWDWASSDEVDLVAKELSDSLLQAGVRDPDVAVDIVPVLERHASTGKLRRFVPLTSEL